MTRFRQRFCCRAIMALVLFAVVAPTGALHAQDSAKPAAERPAQAEHARDKAEGQEKVKKAEKRMLLGTPRRSSSSPAYRAYE